MDLNQDPPTPKRARIDPPEMNNTSLSTAEAELYDRQIRLWGVEAQKRLNKAKVLVIGLNGLGAEVAKNIVLGGVKLVVLMDSQMVTELDASSQFLVSMADVGQNRATASLESAQKLNPMVQLIGSTKNCTEETDFFFEQFNVICSIENSKEQNVRLDGICRNNGIAFFTGDVFGFFGHITIDLGEEFEYAKSIKVHATETVPEYTTEVVGTTKYVPYLSIMNQEKDDNSLWSGKRTHPTLFAFYVLMDFVEAHKRAPNAASRDDDFGELLRFRDDFCKKQGVSVERIPDELFEYVFGKLGPVCAVTGGVLSQEIVKAISHRDEPLNNLFLFNPLHGTGVVETVK